MHVPQTLSLNFETIWDGAPHWALGANTGYKNVYMRNAEEELARIVDPSFMNLPGISRVVVQSVGNHLFFARRIGDMFGGPSMTGPFLKATSFAMRMGFGF
jgi:hypothetical protein